MEKLKLDLIESLHSQYLDFICDQIFAYLDYDSLTNSKMVSVVWKNIISKGAFWKVMVERKKNVLPYWKKVFDAVKVFKDKELLSRGNADASERHCEYYHTMYCLVEDEIQKSVDSNWRAGGKHQCVKYESFGNHSFGVHGCECEVDSQWIVQIQRDCRIFLRNRWTLELEKVLEIPLTEINMNGRDREVKLNRLKINSNFITASFDVHPEICVWDAKSHELLRVLKPVPEQGNQVEGEYGEFYVKGHCLWNDLLLSCHARLSEADESYIVTLRRIPLNGDGEATLLYFQKVLPRPILFLEVAMDDDYIVLFFARHEQRLYMPSMAATFEIEIRSAVSYDVVHKISIPTSSPFQRYQFHYLNGFIVMGQTEDNLLSIWIAAVGRCVNTICHGDKGLCAIRIISDKYIVTCDKDGVLKIWDFQGTLIRPEPFSSNFLIRKISHLKAVSRSASAKPSVVSSKVKMIDARKKTPRVPPIEYVGSSCMVADELQMILVSHSEDGSSYLHVETFLNAAQ
ncbi:hypothetical protein DAPPUDRAFT_331044 [Daphnia pulex]|uniref:F-box domain-containing protein n=1 Tax=Daphnia pulex TaxID=6669 RepID=E9HLC0_DAPPU|nr:hypothetical protein DAPPUDRAFT_331044 [Daphnia pulex]|eukprot:EFX67476.1 hypothetical protein DAPPUDRAFT_331044 [Daphnia pulex]